MTTQEPAGDVPPRPTAGTPSGAVRQAPVRRCRRPIESTTPAQPAAVSLPDDSAQTQPNCDPARCPRGASVAASSGVRGTGSVNRLRSAPGQLAANARKRRQSNGLCVTLRRVSGTEHVARRQHESTLVGERKAFTFRNLRRGHRIGCGVAKKRHARPPRSVHQHGSVRPPTAMARLRGRYDGPRKPRAVVRVPRPAAAAPDRPCVRPSSGRGVRPAAGARTGDHGYRSGAA